MRKLPALLAVLGLTAVGLAGCAVPAGFESCPRPSSTTSATDLVTVSGEVGKEPDVSVNTPFHVDETSFSDAVTGDGPAISSDNQAVVLDITIVSGKTGEPVVATQYNGDASRVNAFSRWTQAVPALDTALECATEGSRIVVAIPPGGIETETAASLGLGEKDSAVAIVDLQKVYLPRAQGSLVYNDAMGMPTVVRAPDGRPGVIVPDSAAPEKLTAQTLIKGDGEKVSGDQNVRVNYTSVSWDDRKVIETTWDSEAASTTLEALVPGAAKALGDVTVGSQLLVVVPAEKASGGSSASGARVFVIDVLGVDAAAAQ
ncbi:FKBP-type peptidyl-prolyl cis-trans isomerase [Microbacterium sp. B2969]|uniref:FKBP-type peptidyl-prolyl cis-trans isomerase n=1 Tax=Microbacterium alkaliflavum TaxID=3248839 RepID=A0ABW7Q4J5_9MICO